MSKYPTPKNESKRLEKLHSYNILDTYAEDIFDDLTKMVAKLLNVPIVLVSLVDKDRQWFKSKVGLEANETPREISFCRYTIMQDEILEVENAHADERFNRNPLVTGNPNIAFYAGAPLTDNEGFNIGTLCAIDTVPKTLTEFERSILDTVSKTIMRLIEFRKKQEEQVIYNKFFDLTLDMLCVASTDGFFKLLNPSFTKIMGWSEEDLMRNKFIDYIHPEDVDTTIKEFKKLRKGYNAVGFQNRFKTKAGKWLWLEWTCYSDQNTKELFAVARDITDLKEIQTGLINEKKETEKLTLAKDEFLANMSHEIRTPLNSILGFLDLLSKTSLNEEQKQYVDISSIASKNLAVLVNDILDISKLESGRILLEDAPINVEGIIKQVIHLLSSKASVKNIKLMSTIDNSIPAFLQGDETRITQILVNLIGNAIKFTDSGFVEVKVMEIHKNKEYVSLRFSVKDSGIGIPLEKQHLIFERFTQAETSTTRLYGGTGLGLNIVKMLVDLFGGKLELESLPGKGSEFSFELTLPISINKNKEASNVGLKENSVIFPSNTKILLAEDNEHNQIIAKIYLAKYGINIDIASNGKVAFDMIKQKKYDLIIMDLQMPIMDGFETTFKIRNELKLNTPIIACSAHSLVAERIKSLSAGMNEYIAKPYTENQLINVIKTFINNTPETETESNQLKVASKTDNIKDILMQFEKEEGEEFVTLMLNIFKKRIPLDIMELEYALSNNHLETIKNKAHFISGSLASLRFDEGREISKKTEKAAANVEEENAKVCARDLINYLENVLTNLN